MELRVLKYFLAVAREESITLAARSLHLSQPTLSKQIRDMEVELGKELMKRGSRRVTLTPEGLLLKKRAEEILELVGRTEDEIHSIDDSELDGDLMISAGESRAMGILMQAAAEVMREHSLLHIRICSGDTVNVLQDLESGQAEFGLQFSPVDHSRFNCLTIPYEDVWGVLMRADDPLAARSRIHASDLYGLPLLVSRQSYAEQMLPDWFENSFDQMDVRGIYTLAYNAAIMVEQGIGYALVIDGIVSTEDASNLVFRPLHPQWKQSPSLIWHKHQRLSRTGEIFLGRLQEMITR